ncbi:ABC-type polar amino acid transport system ATPase subunit [Methanococcus maripaludis]|uniref:ABC-type polar amino acid transport system ATPase subunit n=1 Tax=Methanococcus maripaludis TaxID=39152 RepID=A0A7J9PUS2_METMI|nr:DUF2540 domain-containing protein [Methanococcus maripaludis]MBA2841276.1 ABC-type polar amino acid transport system ATPase subunit [Methanococcus maripaludis]MBA2869455.1 ABC-type polar amino acid transport system ATPase subunit [Methanococcus maripaludis]
MRMNFRIIKKMDARDLRYFLHRLDNTECLDPEIVKKILETKKEHKTTLILSKNEEKIIQKYGRAINLMLNHAIIEEETNV